MNMHWIDWLIVVVTTAFVVFMATVARKYTRSVADFLAANRTAGRYLLNVAGDMSGVGAITVVATFEIYYQAGFPPIWWMLMGTPIAIVLALSGWIIYRFRETRALTLAQFFEMRYSRNFRIFAGILAFVSGLLNFGIFPAVGARFFIYYCGLPEHIHCMGMAFSMFALIMFVLLSIALFFTFVGGQITIIVTDFVQGAMSYVLLLAIVVVLMFMFDWSKVVDSLYSAPAQASMINPFKTSQVKDFNLWFFLIAMFGNIYNYMSWQGTQAYNSSAKSAHESKMARVIFTWRGMAIAIALLCMPIYAYTVMHHSDYASIAADVNRSLSGISESQIRTQMTVPVVLSKIFPVGVMGAFCAFMVAAFIGTHDIYLHSWGSIFIQDVVMPFRQKPLAPREHMQLLRWSIFGVAVFIFIFSLLFRQTTYIMMYFAITAAIFTGGAGAVIVGGLYWKKGTTAAAWASMLVGSVLAVAGIAIRQLWQDFPINEQWMFFISMVSAILVYVIVSLASSRREFDLDTMLHRNAKAAGANNEAVAVATGWKALRFTKEFTKSDKWLAGAFIVWTLGWWGVFLAGTIYNLLFKVSDNAWAKYWHYYLLLYLGLAIITAGWFIIGGILDLRFMFAKLSTMHRNDNDDGAVSMAEQNDKSAGIETTIQK